MTAQYDPEFAKAIEPLLAATPPPEPVPLYDALAKRAGIESTMIPLMDLIPPSPDVEVTIHHAKAEDGFSVPIYHYHKKTTSIHGLEPGILHMHGGGHIALSVASCLNMDAEMVSATGVQMFSVDYRLAPEHPFPTQIEDCYVGLKWLYEHAEQFNIDINRIGLYGESAGGGLAAGLAIMARDRQLSPPIVKQVLMYPMLDDRTLQPHPLADLMTWKPEDSMTAWTAYVGKNAGKEGISPYAAPSRVESVEGLPPMYMEIGTLDLFRDEDIEYMARLTAANIPVEFHLYTGVPHAFEYMARGTKLVERTKANKVRALTSF